MSEKKKMSWEIALLGLALTVPVIAFQAYVLSVLWVWFVVPLGVVSVSVAHATGLMAIIAYSKSWQRREDFSDEVMFNDICRGIVKSAYLILVGWIAHKAMA
ncbi:hypothetical protein TA3x_000378 [Tundrisphaera sp. TA3]|uniref:hypothetical protein n=1 Tax=Tundrisphaera sp. TA3 TaxID=3435775 RepID=UPI003EBEB1B6